MIVVGKCLLDLVQKMQGLVDMVGDQVVEINMMIFGVVKIKVGDGFGLYWMVWYLLKFYCSIFNVQIDLEVGIVIDEVVYCEVDFVIVFEKLCYLEIIVQCLGMFYYICFVLCDYLDEYGYL